MVFPQKIQSIIGNRAFTVDKIGMSDSQVICFDDMVLKVEKRREESDNEYTMMKWLQNKMPVPEILCYVQTDNINYLLMSKVDGRMLCDDEFLTRPEELVKFVVKGLKILWGVNIADCPYNNSVENKLRLAELLIENGRCDMESAAYDIYGENEFKTPADLLSWLKEKKTGRRTFFFTR